MFPKDDKAVRYGFAEKMLVASFMVMAAYMGLDLVTKYIHNKRISDAAEGVYSHRNVEICATVYMTKREHIVDRTPEELKTIIYNTPVMSLQFPEGHLFDCYPVLMQYRSEMGR